MVFAYHHCGISQLCTTVVLYRVCVNILTFVLFFGCKVSHFVRHHQIFLSKTQKKTHNKSFVTNYTLLIYRASRTTPIQTQSQTPSQTTSNPISNPIQTLSNPISNPFKQKKSVAAQRETATNFNSLIFQFFNLKRAEARLTYSPISPPSLGVWVEPEPPASLGVSSSAELLVERGLV